MAKTYTYPGVYVEDVSPLSRPIAGVSTSTAGFIGISADIAGKDTAPTAGKDQMPENPTGTPHPFYEQQPAKTPKLVTSWNEFQQFFGSVCTSNKLLALAVYGFFENGGSRCYVARINAYVKGDFEICLNKFAAIDEISILASPGSTRALADVAPSAKNEVHMALVAHCQLLENRIAILDCDAGIDPKATPASIKDLLPGDDDGYSAFYCPWIQVSDPTKTGAKVLVPPSGAIAGIYARSDFGAAVSTRRLRTSWCAGLSTSNPRSPR